MMPNRISVFPQADEVEPRPYKQDFRHPAEKMPERLVPMLIPGQARRGRLAAGHADGGGEAGGDGD